MKNIVLFLMIILLSTSTSAYATDTVESPKTCAQCGMSRAAFAHSRMLVVYADGTGVGLCSLYCAALELQNNKDKPVRSLMVADYFTNELLDARTAVWVTGGKKKGVMTAQAKWAFSKAEDARRFVKENGGTVTTFDQAMNYAAKEVMDQAAEERAVESEILREMRQSADQRMSQP